MKNIKIIGIFDKKRYKIGTVSSSRKGDIYFSTSFWEYHLSRHASGMTHLKRNNGDLLYKLGKRKPIEKIEGLEFLGTLAINMDEISSHKIASQSEKKKKGIEINLDEYKGVTFNLTVAALTEKGIPVLEKTWKKSEKTKMYLFKEFKPMIGIAITDVKLGHISLETMK